MAAGLRVHALDRASFAIDELVTVHFATGRDRPFAPYEVGVVLDPPPMVQELRGAPPWWRVSTAMGEDTHPPLHPIMLRGWLTVFGESDSAARMLSVVFSLAALLLLFDAVRTLHGDGVALLAAALCAVSGAQILYAQEVRSYMMLVMLSAGALAVGARLIVRGGTALRCALFGMVALAMMLTHYFAIGLLAPLFAYLIVSLQRHERTKLLIATAAAAALFLIVWGPFFWGQRNNFSQNTEWISDVAPHHFVRTLGLVALLPAPLLFGTSAWLPPAALIFVAPFLVWRRNPRVLLWLGCVVGPILLVAMSDLKEHRQTIALIRYSLLATMPLCALLASMFAHVPAPGRYFLPLLGILMCVAAWPTLWNDEKPPWRALVAETSPWLTREDALVVKRRPGREWFAAVTYMAITRYARGLPCPVIIVDDPASDAVLTRLRRARAVVVVASDEVPIGKYLPGAEQIVASKVFPKIGTYTVVHIH